MNTPRREVHVGPEPPSGESSSEIAFQRELRGTPTAPGWPTSPDGERAAGDDPHGQRDDGPHTELPRIQDVRAVPGAAFVPVAFDAGRYAHGAITLPRVDAIAAKDASGTLWLALTNVDPTRPAEIATTVTAMTARSVTGETLTAPAVDSVNTFEAPATVVPKPAVVRLDGSRLMMTLAPKSVTVVGVRP
jgi:Alpha-L-arabinofuranosidase C-terminal domain